MKPCLLLSCSTESKNREKVYEERKKTYYMPVTGWKIDSSVLTQTRRKRSGIQEVQWTTATIVSASANPSIAHKTPSPSEAFKIYRFLLILFSLVLKKCEEFGSKVQCHLCKDWQGSEVKDFLMLMKGKWRHHHWG